MGPAILLIASACSGGQVTGEIQTVSAAVTGTVTRQPEPTSTIILPPALTNTPERPTASPITNPTSTPVTLVFTPTAAPLEAPGTIFEICSPLAAETIPELWEIVSDPYKPPPPGKDERHHGVDFSYYRRGERTGIQGESIQAILPGTVAAVVQDRLPYGNMVILETSYSYFPPEFAQAISLTQGQSLYHLYAHMETTPTVSIGEAVACGQVLGTVGLTGYYIVNPHLHLETRRGPSGVIFEGMVFYDTSAMPEEMENYKRWRTGGEFQHFDPMVLFDRYLQFLETDDPP